MDPGDKNHMETIMNRPHKKKVEFEILDNQEFSIFLVMNITMKYCFSCLFYFYRTFFRFSLEPPTGQGTKAAAAPKWQWKVRMSADLPREVGNIWNIEGFKNRWFLLFWGRCHSWDFLKRGFRLHNTPPESFFSVEHFQADSTAWKTSKTCLWGEGMFDEEGLDTWTCFFTMCLKVGLQGCP